jgi:hypothetical protein
MLNEAIDNSMLAVDTAYALSKYGKTIGPPEIYKEIRNQLLRMGFANGAKTEIKDEAERLLAEKEFITRIYKELNKYEAPFEEPK